MNEIDITGYVPGAVGWVTQMHGTYYHTHWDLGLYFEAKVATELGAFMSRFDPRRDGAWFARDGEKVIGAIFIDSADAAGEGARLRWFIIDPAYQGRGVGHRLMQVAMDFCARAGFRRVYLTTFAGLNAARHLYEHYGFRLHSEEDGSHLTGRASLVEQKFELLLSEEIGEARS